ncbi:MAG: hypothetical protein IKS99_03635 [Firmicutes bacterium]|nr:hypothetical protein [Bacillota bacterium]
MTNERKRDIIIFASCILIAVVSFFAVAPYMSDPATFSKTIESLDAKKTTVAEMTAAATAASAAITLLPNDIGTPIAEKLVDLSGYFILIFSAIYLEKFLTTVAGYIVFRYLLPLTLIALGINRFLKTEVIRRLGLRIIAFCVILMILVPASVGLSNLIENTHDIMIQQTIDEANEAADEINENNDAEDSSVLEQFLEKVKGGVSGQIDKYQTLLSNFIDSVAVLIVTTCVIPIVVLVVLVVVFRQLFGVAGSVWEDAERFKGAKNSLIKR